MICLGMWNYLSAHLYLIPLLEFVIDTVELFVLKIKKKHFINYMRMKIFSTLTFNRNAQKQIFESQR